MKVPGLLVSGLQINFSKQANPRRHNLQIMINCIFTKLVPQVHKETHNLVFVRKCKDQLVQLATQCRNSLCGFGQVPCSLDLQSWPWLSSHPYVWLPFRFHSKVSHQRSSPQLLGWVHPFMISYPVHLFFRACIPCRLYVYISFFNYLIRIVSPLGQRNWVFFYTLCIFRNWVWAHNNPLITEKE